MSRDPHVRVFPLEWESPLVGDPISRWFARTPAIARARFAIVLGATLAPAAYIILATPTAAVMAVPGGLLNKLLIPLMVQLMYFPITLTTYFWMPVLGKRVFDALSQELGDGAVTQAASADRAASHTHRWGYFANLVPVLLVLVLDLAAQGLLPPSQRGLGPFLLLGLALYLGCVPVLGLVVLALASSRILATMKLRPPLLKPDPLGVGALGNLLLICLWVAFPAELVSLAIGVLKLAGPPDPAPDHLLNLMEALGTGLVIPLVLAILGWGWVWRPHQRLAAARAELLAEFTSDIAAAASSLTAARSQNTSDLQAKNDALQQSMRRFEGLRALYPEWPFDTALGKSMAAVFGGLTALLGVASTLIKIARS